jgi:hypothetical protein
MNDEEQILQNYKNFYAYKIAGDTAGLDKILAPDFTLTHMTGYVQSKAEWCEQIKSGQMKYYGYEIDDVKIGIQGDSATLIGRSKTDARIYGARNTWNLELAMPMIKLEDRWIIQKAVAKSY